MQHDLLFSSTMFRNIFALARAEIRDFWTRKWPTSSTFSFFSFFIFCAFPFSSFLIFLLAAEIDLLLGLLPVQNVLRKHHQEGQILPWSSHVQLKAILL